MSASSLPTPTPIPQVVSPGRWSLGASSGHVQLKQHLLTLVRRADHVSSRIKNAISGHTLIPVVEVQTPKGRGKLLNAKVLTAGLAKSTNPSQTMTDDWERLTFSFQKIEWSWSQGGATAADDWEI